MSDAHKPLRLGRALAVAMMAGSILVPITQAHGQENSLKQFCKDFLDGVWQNVPGSLTNPNTIPDHNAVAWQVFDTNLQQDNIEAQLAYCRDHPETVNPRVLAWMDLIDFVKTVDDPRAKAAIVNGWVNAMISYDYGKRDGFASNKFAYDQKQKKWTFTWNAPASYRHNNFFQTPLDTLVNGKGICGDQAILKKETLERAGFPAKDMELISGQDSILDVMNRDNDGEHMVLLVNVDGAKRVLDNQSPYESGIYTKDYLLGNKDFRRSVYDQVAALYNYVPGEKGAILRDNKDKRIGVVKETLTPDYLYLDHGLRLPAGWTDDARPLPPVLKGLDSDSLNAIGTDESAEIGMTKKDIDRFLDKSSTDVRSQFYDLIGNAFALNVQARISPPPLQPLPEKATQDIMKLRPLPDAGPQDPTLRQQIPLR